MLAGVKSVTIFDNEPVKIEDLGAQFFLHKEDLGKRRDAATLQRLAELNPYVPTATLDTLDNAHLDKFQVVVATEQSWDKLVAMDNHCHARGIQFIAAQTRGLFGWAFNDFGKVFEVIDQTGEEPLFGMIAAISTEGEGIVTTLDETRHGLEDGDYVTFTEINGMDKLNNAAPRKIKGLGPYTFSIGDTTDCGTYKSGGIFTQVKQPKLLEFVSVSHSSNPVENFEGGHSCSTIC